MLLIRRIEERLGDLGKAGELPGNVHLYIGKEAVATGVCAHLDDSDWVASTHRGHGHFLAKGGDPRAMAAELMGKETGIRSEEHTSELQSLMRNSYAVFGLKNKNTHA